MSITDLMNQTISVKTVASYDGLGDATVSAGVSVAARVEPENLEVVLPGGRTLVAQYRIFVPAGTTVAAEDKITYDGADHEIISVEEMKGRDGTTHHIELLVRRA